MKQFKITYVGLNKKLEPYVYQRLLLRIDRWKYVSKTINNATLDLSDLYLEELPPLPRNLKSLNCSYNKLKKLQRLPNSLEKLDCSNNRLTSIQQLRYIKTIKSNLCNIYSSIYSFSLNIKTIKG